MKLWKPLCTVLLLLLITQGVTANDAPEAGLSAPNIDSITLEDVKSDVYFLASDEMQGRETAKPNAKVAAAYVRSRMERVGVEPAGENGSWYQNVKLKYNAWDGTPNCTFTRNDKASELKYGEDFVSTGASDTSFEYEGEIVVGGYAINDTKKGYNDLEGLDLSGKLVLIYRYEPTPWTKAGRNPFSRNAYLQTKEALLMKAGAVGILMVTGPESRGGSDNRRNLPSPDAGEKKSPPLQLDLPPEQARDNRGRRGGGGLPFFHVSVAGCDKLLGGEGETSRVQKLFDKGELDERPDMSTLSVTLSAKSHTVKVEDRNVAGMIKGETDEWIVFGAHHDHLGYGYFGARDARTAMGEVHNGADDNASGVSTVLEIAEALAKSGKKPRRSFLFLTFTGEEKGLLGSRWYVRHPLIPHERVVAMINIDMIGRINKGKLSLDGTSCSKLLDRVCKDVAPLFPSLEVGFSDKPPMPASDHWPFYSEAGIPCFFPFGGMNKLMHTAKDDAETLNYKDLTTTIRMLYEIAWRLSEDKAHADYTGPVKGAVGPDGKPRNPSESLKPKEDPSAEQEEEFSAK